MILFGREDPRSWRDLLRYVVHTHVKLFESDADGRDPCIAYDELLPMLLESGYDGVLSWEYEGWLWPATSPSTTDHLPTGPDVIAAHQRYVRTVLEA